jgi:hypothetical protein
MSYRETKTLALPVSCNGGSCMSVVGSAMLLCAYGVARRLSGLLQRYGVTSGPFREAQPRYIFTSNAAYGAVVQQWGFRCQLLPLHSNIMYAG